MQSTFILNIFPTGSLSGSVITTVWLGVWVVVFFNLRLGWVLSGLVVPGYLVPLMLVKPWAAVIVIVEAVITYGLVWLYSERLSRWIGFTNFFGRDRFFALLLTSVMVRVVFDVLLWPMFGEYLNQTFQLGFDYRNNLHSFGLIVVALIANQFWKPGFSKGLVVLATTVLITYFLVRGLLMPFTNFEVGNLAYMYENLASSMLAGPKAYIILLTTAYIASHLNLRYSWEYSGIMIPALLALEWYNPFKLLVTFGETFIILILGSLLLRLPVFRKTTIEGARKILFFFNLSFAYKLILGHIIVNFFPRYVITDYYGFGYLLTTLMAVKMHDKEIAARITRAVVQTSFVSLILATVIGFSLTHVPNIFSIAIRSQEGAIAQAASFTEKRGLLDLVKEEQVKIYQSLRRNSFTLPLPEERDAFREGLRFLKKSLAVKDEGQWQEARKLFAKAHYTLSLAEDRYLVLREQSPRRGWGLYVINLQADNHLQLQVPEPIGEWGTIYSGLSLFNSFNGESLAIASSRRNANDDGSADVLINSDLFFSAFQEVFGRKAVLQVRGLSPSSQRRITGRDSEDMADIREHSLLMVGSSLPHGANLTILEELIDAIQVNWEPSPFANQLRVRSSGGFAELFLTRGDRRTLLFKPYFQAESMTSESSLKSIGGYLQDWILTKKDAIAEKGSNLYRKPTLEELLFIDNELLTPLVRFLEKYPESRDWQKEQYEELRVLKATATLFGYDFQHYIHQITGQEYLILAEQEGDRNYWGTYIFRLGRGAEYLVQVPRPLSERNIFEYAVSLFETIDARALLIGGSHPLANSDGSADVTQLANKENLFNLVNQVLLREIGDKAMLVIQCRAFSFKEEQERSTSDVLVAFNSGLSLTKEVSSLADHLLKVLKDQYQFSLEIVSGEPGETGYEVGGIPQALYLEQSTNKEFVNLWLSPVTRTAFRQQDENRLLAQQFSALQIETLEQDFFLYLQKSFMIHSPLQDENEQTLLQQDVREYVESLDILALKALLSRWPNLLFRMVVDMNSKQAFLVAHGGSGQVVLVANLSPLQMTQKYLLHPNLTRQELSAYIDSRSVWLLPGKR